MAHHISTVTIKLLNGDLLDLPVAQESTGSDLVAELKKLYPHEFFTVLHPESGQPIESLSSIDPGLVYYLFFDTDPFLDWIDKSKLDWRFLCCRPQAISYIKTHLQPYQLSQAYLATCPSKEAIQWFEELEREECVIGRYDTELSKNPALIHLSEDRWSLISRYQLWQNPNIEILQNLLPVEMDDWEPMSQNPVSYPMLIKAIRAQEDSPEKTKHLKRLNWYTISMVPSEFTTDPVFESYINYASMVYQHDPVVIQRVVDYTNLPGTPHYMKRLCWDSMCLSTYPGIMDTLSLYPEYINVHNLLFNPHAISYIRQNPDLVVGDINSVHALCSNPHPEIIHVLKEIFPDPEQWNWHSLSQNPSAIELLRLHPEKIDYTRLSYNPAIFKNYS